VFPNFNSCDKIKGSLEYNKRMIGMAAKKEGWTLIGRAPEPKREQKLCKIVNTIKENYLRNLVGSILAMLPPRVIGNSIIVVLTVQKSKLMAISYLGWTL
jgi:hypothetical protein